MLLPCKKVSLLNQQERDFHGKMIPNNVNKWLMNKWNELCWNVRQEWENEDFWLIFAREFDSRI